MRGVGLGVVVRLMSPREAYGFLYGRDVMVDAMVDDGVLPPRVVPDRGKGGDGLVGHGGVPVDWERTVEAVRELSYKLAVTVELMVACRAVGLVPLGYGKRIDAAITEASSIGNDHDRVMGGDGVDWSRMLDGIEAYAGRSEAARLETAAMAGPLLLRRYDAGLVPAGYVDRCRRVLVGLGLCG